MTCPLVCGEPLLTLPGVAGGRWPWDGGPALQQWGTHGPEPGHCHKWHMKWHPQTPSLLTGVEVGAFVVPKKQRWAGPVPPRCKLCPQRCHQTGLTGMCSDPCPAKLAPVLMSQPGGRPAGVCKLPALPSDGGTRMASLGRQHRDWPRQDGTISMASPGWWHQDWPCWDGFAGTVALGPASLGWHQDGLARMVAPG